MLVHRPLPTCSSPVMHHSPAPPASPLARRLDAATGEHLGSSHKLLVGRASRVLAFGFLYDMRDHADHVIVTRVEEAVVRRRPHGDRVRRCPLPDTHGLQGLRPTR